MDDFDSLLERAKEESLRVYKEVELPRRSIENGEGCSKDHCADENIEILSQNSPLYKGKEAEGFHLPAGKTYVYPSNYAVRKYQADIVPTALFHNTLVCLPTGLGKTFIAAVVMYNFYRWYPMGKVIFMAPTKPLVAQQMSACRDIMAIPTEDTIEMTGSMSPQERQLQWKIKRVLYLTPQVMINDLRNNLLDPSSIKCLVIDEAHRATKGYAYCQVTQHLFEAGILFRLVALSATPGSDVKAIKELIQILRIEKLEVRSEDCSDVSPYLHSKNINKIVVKLSPFLQNVWSNYLQIYETYYRRIRDTKTLTANISTMSKFQVLMACRKFTANPPSSLPKNIVQMMISDFNVCVSLAHARELLETYGVRVFYNYFLDAEKSTDKGGGLSRLCHNPDLRKLLGDIEKSIQQNVTDPKKYIWSHPKFENMVNIIKNHFNSFENSEEKTKAIVFCQFRLVVLEVFGVLEKFVPEVKPVVFIGQSGKEKGEGLPQKKQLEVMKKFRSGEYNVLIATCVAEEGLDIGDVDLLVLMEAFRSPVRLVQRLGRTGRHRGGQCFVLVTKGMEERKFFDGMSTHKNYMKIVNSPQVTGVLQKYSPRMIPNGCTPVRLLLHIKIPVMKTPGKNKSKQSDIRKIFSNCSPLTKHNNAVEISSPFLNEKEMEEVKAELGSYVPRFDRLPPAQELWHRRHGSRMCPDELISSTWSSLSVWNDWNMELQKTFVVGHSKDANILVHVLNKAKELKSGKKSVSKNVEEPSCLWSTVGSSKKPLLFEKEPKNLSKFSLLKSNKIREKDNVEESNFIRSGNCENLLIPECRGNVIFVNENINNLLDNVLKDYDSIYCEVEETSAIERSKGISNSLKKFMIPINEKMKPSFLDISTDILKDITYDDLKSINIKELFKEKKDVQLNNCSEQITFKKSKTDYFSPMDICNDETDVNILGDLFADDAMNSPDNLNNLSVSDENFIEIDELLNKPEKLLLNRMPVDETSNSKCLPIISEEIVFEEDFDRSLRDLSCDSNVKQSSSKLKSSPSLSSQLKPIFKKDLTDENFNANIADNKTTPVIKTASLSTLKPIFKRDLEENTDKNTIGNPNSLKSSVFNDECLAMKENYCDSLAFSQKDKLKMSSDLKFENVSVEPKGMNFVDAKTDDSVQFSQDEDFVGIDDLLKTKDDDSCKEMFERIKSPELCSSNRENSCIQQELNVINENKIPDLSIKEPSAVLENTDEKKKEDIIKKYYKDSDESSHDSDDFIPGTPENRIPLKFCVRTPEMLKDVAEKLEKSLSPILSGRPATSKRNSNICDKVFPILSGRYTPSFFQVKCSTPITIAKKDLKKELDKENSQESSVSNPQNENELRKLSTDKTSKLRKNLFTNGNNLNSDESSDYNEDWEIDVVFKDSFKTSSNINATQNKLSYYLNGDSLYSVTQLVEKAEELGRCVEKFSSGKKSTSFEKGDQNLKLFNKDKKLEANIYKTDSQNGIDHVESLVNELNVNNVTFCPSSNSFEKCKNDEQDIIKNLNDAKSSKSKQLEITGEQCIEFLPKKKNDQKSKFILWDSSEDDFFTNLSPVNDHDNKTISNGQVTKLLSQNKLNVSNKNVTANEDKKIRLLSQENANEVSKPVEKNNYFDEIIDLTMLDEEIEICNRSAKEKDESIVLSGASHKQPDISNIPLNKTDGNQCGSKIKTIFSHKFENLCDSSLEISKNEECNENFLKLKHDVVQNHYSLNSTSKSSNKSITPNRSSLSSINHSAAKSKTFSDSSGSESDVFLPLKNSVSIRKRVTKETKDEEKKMKKKIKKHKRNKERRHNVFIDSEAEVSGGTSSGAETSGLDNLDESFIDDFTQKQDSCMFNKYCEAVKNTDRAAGGFKIPTLSDTIMARNVFSQAVPMDHESYINDSFCVDAPESDNYDDDMSYLEQIENLIKMEEKSRKKNKKIKKIKKNLQREKRKRSPSLSGSETDFEEFGHPQFVNNNDSLPIVKKNKKRRIINSESSESD